MAQQHLLPSGNDAKSGDVYVCGASKRTSAGLYTSPGVLIGALTHIEWCDGLDGRRSWTGYRRAREWSWLPPACLRTSPGRGNPNAVVDRQIADNDAL